VGAKQRFLQQSRREKEQSKASKLFIFNSLYQLEICRRQNGNLKAGEP